jgi:hypothetical protein
MGTIQKITALKNAGQLTDEQVNGIAVTLGLASFALLGSRPDLVPQFNTELDKICPPVPTQS